MKFGESLYQYYRWARGSGWSTHGSNNKNMMWKAENNPDCNDDQDI